MAASSNVGQFMSPTSYVTSTKLHANKNPTNTETLKKLQMTKQVEQCVPAIGKLMIVFKTKKTIILPMPQDPHQYRYFLSRYLTSYTNEICIFILILIFTVKLMGDVIGYIRGALSDMLYG